MRQKQLLGILATLLMSCTIAAAAGQQLAGIEVGTSGSTTTLTVRNGERVLLAVFPTSEPPEHIEFFILKAEAFHVE